MKLKETWRLCLLPVLAVTLSACDSSSTGGPVASTCPEQGEFACKTGGTEPLYTFQWALNYADSYFKDYPDTFGGGMDLNVEPVHRQGIKGQGVNVLVLDSGSDLHNEDLAPNADMGMSWNFVTQQSDPYPDYVKPDDDPHGTIVAGIIGAAQNGKGVMGIAPRANLGAGNYLQSDQSAISTAEALGGAAWSRQAHVINASYGASGNARPYDNGSDSETLALRGLKQLRGGKGAIFVKAAGNSFDDPECGGPPHYYDCTNPGNDPSTLEPHVITVAAVNAFGQTSSYSSAGSVMWISGLGGEFGNGGTYGEVKTGPYSGPTIFSTDMRGCTHGYSRDTTRTPTGFLLGKSQRNGVADNPNCDYAYMNGTSAAAPTISGVVALMLSANPDLSWRDVRDILRLSARKIDPDYIQSSPGAGIPYGARMNLATNALDTVVGSAADIFDGATAVPIDLGWQRNAAGNEHSNWYGFGVPDTQKAVALAQNYRSNPASGRNTDVKTGAFVQIAARTHTDGAFPYERVTLIATIPGLNQVVDMLQLRLSGTNVCLGSIGIAVRSPSGTTSLLKLPNDHFRDDGIATFQDFGLASVAFYGEQAQGNWEVYLLAGAPDGPLPGGGVPSIACDPTPPTYAFTAQARIIGQ